MTSSRSELKSTTLSWQEWTIFSRCPWNSTKLHQIFSGMHQDISLRIALRGIGLLMALAWMAGCSPKEEPVAAVPPVQTFVLDTTTEVPFRRFPGEVAAADT
jgi:hypothetical protein